MRRAFLAICCGLVLAPVTAVAATATTITASPKTGVAGQAMTFKATFTSCGGTIKPHYFTIDGRKYNGKLVMSGNNGTETYSTTALAVGTHVVQYYWQTSTNSCRGNTAISYTVKKATASPTPAPRPSPSPTPPPSPSALPSTAPSPTPVALVSSRVDDSPAAYAGVALIVVSVLAGAGLVVFGRR